MFINEWLRRVRYLRHRQEESAALEEEMRLHRELLAQRLKDTAGDAQRLASIRFGNTTALREQSVSMWEWVRLANLAKDIRHTFRSLAASPFFTGVVVLMLALGIGANTAIFSVANVVLLRLLPVSDAARAFYLHVLPGQPSRNSNSGNPVSSFSYPVFAALRTQQQAFRTVLAYVPAGWNKVPVRTGDLPREASVDMVSGDFFSGLGVALQCGGGFRRSDEDQSNTVAVVSAGFATEQFGNPCDALGKTVLIKGVPFTATGVVSARFTGVESTATDMWIPLQRRAGFNAWGFATKDYHDAPKWWCLKMIVRLQDGVSEKQALAKASLPFLRAAYEPVGGKPQRGEEPRRLDLIPARGLAETAADFQQPLQILFVMVGLILLIACGNVAMLLVGRNAARQREFSIRLAMGGSRGRLFQQLLVESLTLVCAGALGGWLFALAATRLLAVWAEIDVRLSPDTSVLLFTLGVSLAIGLLFGVAPLQTALRGGPALALKQSAATAYQDASKSASRRVVLTLQVAMGLTLTLSAGLLVKSLRNLQSEDIGFQADRLLVFGVHSPTPDAAASENFLRALLDDLRQLPGVAAATTVQNRPGAGGSNNTDADIDGRNPQETGASSNMVRWNAVGLDYFRTLGIPLRRGRYLTDRDSAEAANMAVVNETFVQRFFPHRDPVGHEVSFNDQMKYTIAGVVRNSKYTGLREEESPTVYLDIRQVAIPGITLDQVLLRTKSDPMHLLASVRQRLAKFSPNAAPLQPMTLEMQFDKTISNERLMARLALFFGLLALLLVATGLYGTLAYAVARRTSELGIRAAIGAQRRTLLWMVLRENVGVCVAGIMLGLPLSFYAANLLASQLFGLQPHDPGLSAWACGILLVVTIGASAVPAYRAASIDPIRALRYE